MEEKIKNNSVSGMKEESGSPDEGSEKKAVKKSGFATLIGRPNVGKSTLMNNLIGQKIAITSYKPQTTRTQIRTIYTDERGQVVFLDTPGIHPSRTRLGEYMLKAAESTLKEVDLILWLVAPKDKPSEDETMIFELLKKSKTPVILVINKIDTVKKAEILPVISRYSKRMEFAEIVPVSARTGDGLDELRELIFEHLPEGEPFYDEDTVTTETEREIASEIIREKALRLLQEEVPHGIAVTIESMKWRESRKGEICDIEASIICEKNTHKAIVIGKGGEMIRKIGTAARKDIENMLQCRVNLKLWVKVRKGWKDNDLQMKSFGYDMKQYK